VISNRDTLIQETAEIVSHLTYPASQHVMRVMAPRVAALAQPGSFVHTQCDSAIAMRRPISIMRVDASDAWIDLLYKEVGVGTRALANRRVGQTLDLIGPIGRPFELLETHVRPLLIGGGVGIPPVLFLAERLSNRLNEFQPLLLMGSEVPFPFELAPSVVPIAGIDDAVATTLALSESWGIATRLSSLGGFDGCYDGYVTDLARRWLDNLDETERRKVAVYSCGPTPMLKAVAALAKEYELPCQVSLEEFMACAVGGCAGCTVRVRTNTGDAMKRVCVDGPVFEAAEVFFGDG
jgi:dihydroorotate dehydrogenase electron transfer subunit